MVPSGGSDREVLLGALREHLDWLLDGDRPDILLYQAGADPLRDDPYSPLDLSHADLQERDRMVFEFAKKNSLPLTWVLAGGYTKDIAKVVEVHMNTARGWVDICG
jgi:acetoin utilization deacetylase AcuC-like enzyme